MDTDVTSILVVARSLVARPDGWCQDDEAQDEVGNSLTLWDVNDKPTAVCAQGSVRRAALLLNPTLNREDVEDLFDDAMLFLASVMPEPDVAEDSEPMHSDDVVAWYNDHTDSIQSDVVRVFDLAIKRTRDYRGGSVLNASDER